MLALGFPDPPPPASSSLALSIEGFPERLRPRITRQCRAAYRRASAWFGTELSSPVTVRWVTDPDELRRYGVRAPEVVAGLAIPDRNLVCLSAPALSTHPTRVRSVVLHEFCHLLFAEATAGAEVLPPRWLDEGVAMWRSGEWDLGLEWRARPGALLRDAAAAGSILPFRSLEVSFPEGPFFHVAYAQSLSFVEWMVVREGERGIRELLRLLDADLDPGPAFRQVYGLTLEEAQDRWEDSLPGRGWLRYLPSAQTLFGLLWALLGILVVAKFVRTRIQLRRAPDEEE